MQILIDPGMGRRNLVRCLAEAQPEGFVAVPLAQAIRTVLRSRFPQAKLNITVGWRWGWDGVTLEDVRRCAMDRRGGTPSMGVMAPRYSPTQGNAATPFQGVPHSVGVPCVMATTADDPAAMIFTSGSTGPPKGVLYRHGNFDRQVDRDPRHVRHPAGRDRSAVFSVIRIVQRGNGRYDGDPADGFFAAGQSQSAKYSRGS